MFFKQRKLLFKQYYRTDLNCVFKNVLKNTFFTNFSYFPDFQTNSIIENLIIQTPRNKFKTKSFIKSSQIERERERGSHEFQVEMTRSGHEWFDIWYLLARFGHMELWGFVGPRERKRKRENEGDIRRWMFSYEDEVKSVSNGEDEARVVFTGMRALSLSLSR